MVLYKENEDSFGLDEVSCHYNPRMDILRVHIVEVLQQLSNASYDFGTAPQPHQLVNPHCTVQGLSDQYQFSPTPVDYDNYEVFYLSTGSVGTRSDCPRERQVEKPTLAGCVCGYCGRPTTKKNCLPTS